MVAAPTSHPEAAKASGMGLRDRYLRDGFEVAGYRAVAAETYDIAAAILEADVWINVPVAKTHGAKITCCMKNHFGILPGRLYGFSKQYGTEGHPGMPHAPRQNDEAFVDLWQLSRVDLNVVDMIRGTQGGAFRGAPRRSNIVLARRDPVATDLTAAKLMGFNPDDFEFADLAWQQGMGPRFFEGVDVHDAGRLEELISRWAKAGSDYEGKEWQEQADYGMGAAAVDAAGTTTGGPRAVGR